MILSSKLVPIIAAILDFINVAFYGGGFIALLIYMFFFKPPDHPSDDIAGFADLLVMVTALFAIPAGVLAGLGGFYTIKRIRWVLSFTAAISVLIPSVVLWGSLFLFTGRTYFLLLIIPAILAIILTALSKREFVIKQAAK